MRTRERDLDLNLAVRVVASWLFISAPNNFQSAICNLQERPLRLAQPTRLKLVSALTTSEPLVHLRSSCLHAIRPHGVYPEAAAASCKLEYSPLAFDRVCLHPICQGTANTCLATWPVPRALALQDHPTLVFAPPLLPSPSHSRISSARNAHPQPPHTPCAGTLPPDLRPLELLLHRPSAGRKPSRRQHILARFSHFEIRTPVPRWRRRRAEGF